MRHFGVAALAAKSDPFSVGVVGDDHRDGEDDADALAEAKKKAEAAKAKDKKKVPIAKSIIVWEVKPYSSKTNLDELAKKILAISTEGLSWKTEYKKEPVAFGVFKLQIGATIVDSLVSTDDVQE